MFVQYNTITNPAHLSKEVCKSNIVGIMRTNADYFVEIIKYFNERLSPYYIHFLDGDYWGKRDL